MNTVRNPYERRRPRRHRRSGADFVVHRRVKKSSSGLTATVRDRKYILLMLLVVGVICIGVIIAGAYAASINYHNHTLKQNNTALQGEVESLQIEIKTANNIANIEKKATKELGMVYPEGKSLVVVSGKQKTDKNFAGNLKKSALE